MPPSNDPESRKAQRDLERMLGSPALPGWQAQDPGYKRAQIRRRAQQLIQTGKWQGLSETQKRLYEKGGQFSAAKSDSLQAQKEFQKRMRGQ